MKINVTKENARFIINPEKRKVVCILDDTSDLFIDFTEDNLPITIWGNQLWETKYISKKLRMPNRFIGIATCSQDDEWDEEIGKTIAFSRAKDKLNRSFFKRANTYVNKIDDWLDQAVTIINNYGEKIETNTTRRHEYINNILGGE